MQQKWGETDASLAQKLTRTLAIDQRWRPLIAATGQYAD
jgi:hypothetical protein